MVLARREEHVGVNSEGFITTVFPAANAPINGSKDNPIGKFQVEIIRTTPRGSETTSAVVGNAPRGKGACNPPPENSNSNNKQ